jgi:hypothetical protein
MVAKVSGPRTVGSLIEHNTQQLGNDRRLAKEAEDKRTTVDKIGRTPRPFYRDTDKPLDLKKISDVGRYIETGKA